MAVDIDRSMRLPEAEFFPTTHPKSGIAIHHTVGGTVESTFRWWQADRAAGGRVNHVGTAYLIERDGTVYEVFDPEAWAYQFGVSWSRARRLRFERRFIGIEIASEGGLTWHDGRLYAYDVIDPVFEKPAAEAFECPALYRGYKWFDRYEPEQLDALGRLVDALCERFSVPRVYPDRPFVYYGDALEPFEGVIGHAMVRLDKSDPAPDPDLWTTLERLAGLTPTPVTAPDFKAARLSDEEIDALFERNIRRIDMLDAAAGSLVKDLLMELERRNSHVELHTPVPGAHEIGYRLLEGDPETLMRLADWLGFEEATDTMLEVHPHA